MNAALGKRSKTVAKCKCGAKVSFLDSICEECLQKETRDELGHYRNSTAGGREQGSEMVPNHESASFSLSTLLYILAALSLFGGGLVGAKLWPANPGYGASLGIVAYIPALISLSSGVVQFAVFAAFGRILEYLRIIASNASPAPAPNKKLQPTTEAAAE